MGHQGRKMRLVKGAAQQAFGEWTAEMYASRNEWMNDYANDD